MGSKIELIGPIAPGEPEYNFSSRVGSGRRGLLQVVVFRRTGTGLPFPSLPIAPSKPPMQAGAVAVEGPPCARLVGTLPPDFAILLLVH